MTSEIERYVSIDTSRSCLLSSVSLCRAAEGETAVKGYNSATGKSQQTAIIRKLRKCDFCDEHQYGSVVR